MDWPRQRVRIEELWLVLDSVDPVTRPLPERRQLLAEALAELVAGGYILFPSQQSFDRIEQPPLPRFVTLPRPKNAKKPPSQVVWHPALAWADAAVLPMTHRAA